MRGAQRPATDLPFLGILFGKIFRIAKSKVAFLVNIYTSQFSNGEIRYFLTLF